MRARKGLSGPREGEREDTQSSGAQGEAMCDCVSISVDIKLYACVNVSRETILVRYGELLFFLTKSIHSLSFFYHPPNNSKKVPSVLF